MVIVKNEKKDVSYNLIIVLMILVLVLVVGSLVTMRFLLRNVQTARGTLDNLYHNHYAFIYTGENSDFWNDVYAGALTKGEELGVYVQDFGRDLTVHYSTQELMRIAMDAQVDGLIIEGDNDRETHDLIAAASEAGIPVVTVMNDAYESDRICFVGIGSYTMGRQYGEQIMKHVPASHKEDIKVEILMDSEYAGSGQSLIISGIFDEFKANGYGDQLRVEAIEIDNSTAFSAEESIRDIILGDDLPDAIVGLNSVYTRCLFQAAVDYNKVGEVYIYGFGDSEDILEAVSKNIVEATMSASTAKLGGSAVEALDEYISTGYVSEYLSQDTEIIMTEQARSLLNPDEEITE